MRISRLWLAPAIGLLPATAHGQAIPDAPRPVPTAADEEIVVTGERGERSIADTASSVVVQRGDEIEGMADNDRIDRLLEHIPNVQSGTGGEGPAIRGQDSTGVLRDLPGFLGGSRPRATIQIDGRALSFNEFVFASTSAWDVEQVEVFRSPQTTTQGRNSIAGAIFIRTRDPTWDWEGRARVLAGNFDTRQASAVVSGPLVADQIAFRFAADGRDSRTSSVLAENIVGARRNEDWHATARLKLLAQPAALPGLRVAATFAHSESFSPQLESARRPFADRRDPAATYGNFGTNVDSLTLVADLEIDERLSLRTTLSGGDASARRFAPPGLGEARNKVRDGSVEAVARWRPGGGAEAIGGVHYLGSRLDQAIDLSAVLGVGAFEDRQLSLGIFGEATVPVGPLRVTAGARYQRDAQRRSGRIGIASLDYDGRFSAFLPKLSVAIAPWPDTTLGLLVQRAYNPGGTTVNFDTRGREDFGAERLWNFEAFGRTRVGGARIAANIFYNRIGNAQRARTRVFSVPGGGTAVWAEIRNLPRAESYGAEIEADWRVDRRLALRAGLGLLETEILATTATLPTLLGRDFQRAPAFSLSAGIDWRPLAGLRLTGQLRHRSGFFSDDINNPVLRVGDATIVDLRAAYSRGPFTLSGYVRNAADTVAINFLLSADRAVLLDPREYGVSLEARF